MEGLIELPAEEENQIPKRIQNLLFFQRKRFVPMMNHIELYQDIKRNIEVHAERIQKEHVYQKVET